MELLKKSFKNALLFGLVGAALALATPFVMPLAVTLGVSSAFATSTLASTSIIWTAMYFAGFGALAVAATPMMDWLFHDAPPREGASAPRGLGIIKARDATPQLAPERDLAMVPQTQAPAHFQEKLAAERAQLQKIAL